MRACVLGALCMGGMCGLGLSWDHLGTDVFASGFKG